MKNARKVIQCGHSKGGCGCLDKAIAYVKEKGGDVMIKTRAGDMIVSQVIILKPAPAHGKR